MLKRLAPFARTNRNKSTPKPMKPSTIISTSAYHKLVSTLRPHYPLGHPQRGSMSAWTRHSTICRRVSASREDELHDMSLSSYRSREFLENRFAFSFRKGADALVRGHAINHFEDGAMHRVLEHESSVQGVVGGRCKNPLVGPADEGHS